MAHLYDVTIHRWKPRPERTVEVDAAEQPIDWETRAQTKKNLQAFKCVRDVVVEMGDT